MRRGAGSRSAPDAGCRGQTVGAVAARVVRSRPAREPTSSPDGSRAPGSAGGRAGRWWSREATVIETRAGLDRPAAQLSVRGEPPALRRPGRNGGCAHPGSPGRHRSRASGPVRAIGAGAPALDIRLSRRTDHGLGLPDLPAGANDPRRGARHGGGHERRLRRLSRVAGAGGPRGRARRRAWLAARRASGTCSPTRCSPPPASWCCWWTRGRRSISEAGSPRPRSGARPRSPAGRDRALGTGFWARTARLVAGRHARHRTDHGRLPRHRGARRASLLNFPRSRWRRSPCRVCSPA